MSVVTFGQVKDTLRGSTMDREDTMPTPAHAPFFRCLRAPDELCDDRLHPVPDPRGTIRTEPGEQVLWRGRVRLAEHVYTEAMDGYRVSWELPGLADVTVTDRRLGYVCRNWRGTAERHSPIAHAVRWGRAAMDRARSAVHQHRPVVVGQVRYEWPHRLYVLPARDGIPGTPPGRLARGSRVLVVCAAYRTEGRPTLLLCEGDVGAVPGADRLANILRTAILRFRLRRAQELGLFPADVAGLRAALTAPGFATRTGGRSQGINLRGGLYLGCVGEAGYRRPDAVAAAGHGVPSGA